MHGNDLICPWWQLEGTVPLIWKHNTIAQRVLSTNDEKWNTIPRTYSEIDTLRNKFKDENDKLKILEEINLYIEEIEKKYQKASWH